MKKGAETKAAIVTEAVAMASVSGLEGLSIGGLADRMGLSKSGLFAHFGSKQSLQRAVLKHAVDSFLREVIRPSLQQPRGEERVHALLENWLRWDEALPGGCPLIAATTELDDRPGPLRDFLVSTQRRWMGVIAHTAKLSIESGHFRGDLEPEQFAFEFNAIGLGHHYSMRLLRNRDAGQRALVALDHLLARVRT